jgi:hypothetical protein
MLKGLPRKKLLGKRSASLTTPPQLKGLQRQKLQGKNGDS